MQSSKLYASAPCISPSRATFPQNARCCGSHDDQRQQLKYVKLFPALVTSQGLRAYTRHQLKQDSFTTSSRRTIPEGASNALVIAAGVVLVVLLALFRGGGLVN